ncbi:uncharacterized protein LOC117101979 isoform X2 [Anneissia japonica]|uniref:uncharacterized protein LOC117101979 isoform X2 n=1 Tax=Anneissia japonica TaxID=1529436 RepID=UPI001425B995|nr:uncharacterized protein LOC117101979 isoform X2 [Anneissia japonica]
MKTLDSDRAPLKLVHDETPMDVTLLNLNQQHPAREHYHFRGFPAHNFSEGTQPKLGPPGVPEADFLNHSFRKKQHFVKGRVIDPAPENTIEYGTNRMAPSRADPLPLKTLFYKEHITSAEKRKREHQMKEAVEDIARFKTEKLDKQLSEREEKRKDLQMLRDYQPWGKPGAGAPKRDTNIRTKALDTVILYDGEPVQKFLAFGKPGHGAPLRTNSGNQVTCIRANHDIRFCDLKGMKEAVNNHARYAVPCHEGKGYADELGNMVLEKRTQREKERYLEKMQEKETWKHDPFGLPGGGAPLKTNSGKLQTRHNITLIKDAKEMRDIEHRHLRKEILQSHHNEQSENMKSNNDAPRHFEDDGNYDPWGKGFGAPDRDEKGRVKRHPWANQTGVHDFIDPKISGGALETKSFGGGGFNVDAKGEKRTKFSVTLDHDRTGGFRTARGHSEPILKDSQKTKLDGGFYPWGKPGGGAPLMDGQGRLAAGISGKMMTDKFGYSKPNVDELKAKQEYLSDLKNGIFEQQLLRRSIEEEIKRPGNEVGPWIREKEVGYPKKDPVTGAVLAVHHKPVSDVTKLRMDIRSHARPSEMIKYNSDLEQQARERHINKQAEKQASRDLSAQHHTNFDRAWGKPGHGAPKTTNNRLSLDMEKEYQGDMHSQAPWTQPHASIAISKPWVRTTALENRFNRYSEQNLPQRAFPVRVPWATYSLP